MLRIGTSLMHSSLYVVKELFNSRGLKEYDHDLDKEILNRELEACLKAENLASIINQTYVVGIDSMKREIKREEERRLNAQEDEIESTVKFTEPDSVVSKKQGSIRKNSINTMSKKKNNLKPKAVVSDIMGMNSPAKYKKESCRVRQSSIDVKNSKTKIVGTWS